MKYLNESLIKDAFLRLRQKEQGGKKGLERTSALLYFLAFDALLKRTGVDAPVDLDPENSIGKNNRDILTREFVRLVQIKNVGSKPCHVQNLGEITIGGTTPEKRFSANFLTVPLKNATTDSKATGYPNRPKPILMLGSNGTGLAWGMDRHPEWKVNLPVFLQERQTKTPFHDLACFVLRQRGFISDATSLQEGIVDGLKEIFTDDLCDYWKSKLSLEKPYMESIGEPFQDKVPNTFDDHSWAECKPSDIAEDLSERIVYLEGLLKMHHIEFETK